jgi:hypothetical protein
VQLNIAFAFPVRARVAVRNGSSPLAARGHGSEVVAMSNTGLFTDRSPIIRSAGVTSALANESARACLDYPQPAKTPDHVKTWRKSLREVPGHIVHHPGSLQDLQPDGRTYGRLNYKDASAGDLFNQEPTSEMLAALKTKQEAVYASSSAEPLGHSMHRGHKLPDKTKTPDFAFGNKSTSTSGAKEALYPVVNEADDRGPSHEKYLTSHKDYNPGEQKCRGYDWPSTGIDPVEHRFGISEKMAMGGGSQEVMQALDPTLANGERTAVVSKLVEYFKDFANDELGQCKNLGFDDSGLPSDHAYGMAAARQTDWGAGECIKGAYQEMDQLPDKDLGTTLRPGWRNTFREPADEVRKFGVPSVRGDIPAPRTRSVADHQNYGDEPGAFTLIYTSKFATSGVDEIDFVTPKPKATLKAIVQIAFQEVSDEAFEHAYQGSIDGGEETEVSVESWRQAYNTMQG